MTAVTTRVKHLYAKYDTGKLNSKEFLGEIENEFGTASKNDL